MLTVRELVGELGLQLVAGVSGADAPVRWVHLSELADPTPWLSGGEILLIHGTVLDTPERQRDYINLLADHELAGLGLAIGFGHDTVPQALVETADERGFPIFEVPYDFPFIAITEAAFRTLVSDEYALLRRALRAQERLEQLVLSQQGLGSLTKELARLLSCEVVVLDPRGEPLAGGSEELEQLRFAVRDRVHRGERQLFIPRDGALALPVDGEAWLVVHKADGGLSDFERLLLRQAVTIVALELLRARVATDTERRLAGDVMAALLAGELSGPELARRLEPFGVGSTLAAIVGAGAGFEEAVRAEGERGLIAPAGGLTCALVPGRPEEELHALAERIAARAGNVGVGRAVSAGMARRSFHEARCALETVSLQNGHAPHAGYPASMRAGRVATFKDLGSFQLLLSLQDDEALKLFCDSILGVIERSDEHYGGELIRSLEAFIEENGQWERAAKRLYCHRHTLRYRIRRVEELTGRDLGSARDRIEFWLALRGRELV